MILRDFTWFLRNFTWFLHDYTQFLRFLRDFLPGTNFLCQAPKTILHPCWQVHSPWVLWGVFAVISEIMCSWGQLLYNERGRNKEICVHYPGEGDTPSLPRTLINFHFSSLASSTTSPANIQLPNLCKVLNNLMPWRPKWRWRRYLHDFDNFFWQDCK